MADNDTADHDRTEQPTAKRLEDARQQGQVARSRELSMTAVTRGRGRLGASRTS
jgi:flagellar biosynthetic protein FlhB